MSRPLSHLLILAVLLPAVAAAQPTPASGLDLEGLLAASILLSSEEALAWGRYEVDDPLETRLELGQLGVRRRIGESAARPFVGAFAGWALADRRDGSSLEGLTVGIEAGAELLFGGGAFLAPRAAVGYTWADREAPRQVPAGIAGDSEALTGLGSVALGYRWRRPGGRSLEAAVEVVAIHTDVGTAELPELETSAGSVHGRLRLEGLFPLGAEVAGQPLELRAGLSHTDLADEAARLLRSDRLTELALALMLRVGDERLPVDAVGLSFRYAIGDDFEGWAVGIAVSD